MTCPFSLPNARSFIHQNIYSSSQFTVNTSSWPVGWEWEVKSTIATNESSLFTLQLCSHELPRPPSSPHAHHSPSNTFTLTPSPELALRLLCGERNNSDRGILRPCQSFSRSRQKKTKKDVYIKEHGHEKVVMGSPKCSWFGMSWTRGGWGGVDGVMAGRQGKMVGSGSQDGGARWCHRMMCLHRCQSTLLYHYPSLCHATVLITGQLRFHEMIDKYKNSSGNCFTFSSTHACRSTKRSCGFITRGEITFTDHRCLWSLPSVICFELDLM